MSSRRVSPALVRERVVSQVCRRSSVRRWRKRYRELQCFSSYLRRVGSVRFPYPVSFPARMQPTVHLFDASPFLFRSFFSLPKSIVDTHGKPANAVYGFASFVAKYITEEKPTHIAVAFDRHFNASFRNEFYPPYKAHRDASPPELDAQVDPALEVIEALGATTFIDERYE